MDQEAIYRGEVNWGQRTSCRPGTLRVRVRQKRVVISVSLWRDRTELAECDHCL